jgi:hypothetical protein
MSNKREGDYEGCRCKLLCQEWEKWTLEDEGNICQTWMVKSDNYMLGLLPVSSVKL